MPYYRKRQPLLQAVQLTWVNWSKVCDFVPFKDFVGGCKVDDIGMESLDGRLGLKLRLHNGQAISIAVEDQWILKDGNGLQLCGPEEFETDYERA